MSIQTIVAVADESECDAEAKFQKWLESNIAKSVSSQIKETVQDIEDDLNYSSGYAEEVHDPHQKLNLASLVCDNELDSLEEIGLTVNQTRYATFDSWKS